MVRRRCVAVFFCHCCGADLPSRGGVLAAAALLSLAGVLAAAALLSLAGVLAAAGLF